MSESERYESELRAIMLSIADSIEDATDGDIIEEINAQGRNPDAVAQEVCNVLLNSVKAFHKLKLLDAKEKYRENVLSLRESFYEFPASPEECRNLLFSAINDNPYIATALTAQFRDFKNLSDDDVLSLLKQLQRLGVLKDAKKGD